MKTTACWRVDSDRLTVIDTEGTVIARTEDATVANAIVWLPLLIAHFVEHTRQDFAHRQVSQAIRAGRLKRQPCQICGRTPAQAPQQADHCRLLRRRARGIGPSGLPLADRPLSHGRLLAIS